MIAASVLSGNREEYILLREAIFKFPSLIQPIYLSIILPIISKKPHLRGKFFLSNLGMYCVISLITIPLYMWRDYISYVIPDLNFSVMLLTLLIMILRGFGSSLGVIFMVSLDSLSSLLKNVWFVIFQALFLVVAIGLSWQIVDWLTALFYFMWLVTGCDFISAGMQKFYTIIENALLFVYLQWMAYAFIILLR